MKRFLFFSCIIFVFVCFYFAGGIIYQYMHDKLMPRKACLYIWPGDENNRVFEWNPYFLQLKKEFKKHGYDLSTHDINSIYESDIILYVNAWAPLPLENHKDKSYVWFLETPFTIGLQYRKDKHHLFKKIFTYDKTLVDNDKYHYMQLTYSFDPWEEVDLKQKTVLAMQIATNLNYSPNRSLYYERRNLVKWFVENHPEDFEFYGTGWEAMKPLINPKSWKDFNKCQKGYTPNKKDTIKKARFVFAYENCLSDNYVSEKIWDVMNAGCVPIYLGADSIEAYVPKECFINKKDFDTYEKLYDYIKNMSDETYLEYIDCIKNFITHPKEKNEITDINYMVDNMVNVIFENENFADKIINYFR